MSDYEVFMVRAIVHLAEQLNQIRQHAAAAGGSGGAVRVATDDLAGELSALTTEAMQVIGRAQAD